MITLMMITFYRGVDSGTTGLETQQVTDLVAIEIEPQVHQVSG